MPEPAGTAHIPSPRQKVVADALVPEFRFVTGRLPVTPVVKGNPVPLVNTIAVGVPKAGVTKVGDVEPTKLPVPVCPERLVLTALFVAILFPYTIVSPADCGAPSIVHVVFAVVHIMSNESNRLVEAMLPPTPTVVLVFPT